MINYSSNIKVVVKSMLEKVKELQNNPDPLLRAVALAVLPELRVRVHTDGKDSSGTQIGSYSPGYMKVRTGNFSNATRISRGKNKGKNKDAGKFTKGSDTAIFGTIISETPKIDQLRPQYHRTADTKVILSLTRQMENDLSVIAVPGGYGIGYLNPLNFQKAMWCEYTYNKPILSKLTDGEKDLALQTAEQFTSDYLK